MCNKVSVYLDDKNIGFINCIGLPDLGLPDLEVLYSLSVWEKWLSEKPDCVELFYDITTVSKDKIKFLVEDVFYEYDNDLLKWVKVEDIFIF